MKTNMVEIISDGNTAKVLVNGADLAGAITKLKKVDEVDGLKDRVMNLERVTMVHTDEIQKLKIAQ